MLVKTQGVVFRFTRYGESSIIANIFTNQFGLQSYIINGVRSTSARTKMALYQPLTLLDMVVYHRDHASIHRIKEIKCSYPYKKIPGNIIRETIAFFLVEIINKSIKEQSQPKELFEFLESSLHTLDQLESGIENFHLIFMIKLSRQLGFGPQEVSEILSGRLASVEDEQALKQLLEANYDSIRLTNVQRRESLNYLTQFFAAHIENFGPLKSVQVLREILI